MYFMRQILVLALVGVAVVLASSPAIHYAPGASIRSLPIATATPVADAFSWKKSVALQRRYLYGQPAQKPLNGCPEMFSGPVLDCSVCGGEDAAVPGACSQPTSLGGWRCTCNPTTPPSVTTSIVLAIVGSDTATGTYELETLTQYASLKEHITMMTTMSATATASGDTGLETVAAVVLAGGVAWFLADYVGAADAVALLQTPETADGHDDDPTCPDPKDSCADCDGTVGMCTTGANVGCGCDDTTCPADGAEDQPVCADETACAGSDGQCTQGDNEGCNCSQTADCPDLATTIGFWCSLCGGADANGNCLGDPTEDPPNLWQGCECAPDPDWSAQSIGQMRPARNHDTVFANMPDIEYQQPSAAVSSSVAPTSTPLPSAQCSSTDISTVPWNVFSPGVYTNYCNALNAGDKTQPFTQTVNSTGNVTTAPSSRRRDITGRTPPPDPKSYSSFTFDLSWTGGDGSCPSECSTVFYNIAQSICGHSGAQSNVMTNSATLDTGCGVYSYLISNPNAPAAPVVVAPTVGDHTLCANPAISINVPFTLAWVEDAISQFCTGDIVLPTGSSTVPITQTYEYEEVDVQTSIGWSYDGQAGCGVTTNADGSTATTVTAAQCSQYLLSAVNNCNTNTVTDKTGGTYTWSSPIGCIAFAVAGIAGGAGLG